MKTLVLLSALVLLAFQVQADPIQNTDEETNTEEQPGEEDQAVSISFGGQEGSALHEKSLRGLLCYCRKGHCKRGERVRGTCGIRFLYCCPRR
ncbi:mCG112790 [Mus musculus]|uniref:defensin alpha 4 precursor n=1 Tax=Mus musculus TaxID=10090 RepID=UPI0000F3B852|nr:defensin alpha 4 precursor [Mus musculus]AAI34361.1 Defensin related cryptdin 4 [Mus musculus]EDL15559.1 mCG112790 [Mus musculus]